MSARAFRPKVKPFPKPKCVQCHKVVGRLPKGFPLFCSYLCLINHARETHMDYTTCSKCGQWYDQRYENEHMETHYEQEAMQHAG